MRFLNLKRLLTDNRLRRQVRQTFKYRDILEVVRKKEEFRYRLLEVSKLKHSNGEVAKYANYISVINWIINSKDDETPNA